MILRATLTYLAATLVLVTGSAAAPTPIFGNGPVPVERLRIRNPAILPMTGNWKFRVTHGKDRAGAFVREFGNVTATTEQRDHRAIDAFGAGAGYWSSSNGQLPQQWQVDFGESCLVQRVQLMLEDKSFACQGVIEGSDDGKTWKSLADLKNYRAGQNSEVAITPAKCRFMRVVFTDIRSQKGEAKWAFIRHIQITVSQNGREFVWTPESDPKDAALADFGSLTLDETGFATVPVPSNWEVLGFSKPTYNDADNAVGIYRRVVDVPASFTGQQVLWHFDGVFETAEVFINGKRVGSHESGFTAFDLNVTNFVIPGKKNLFAVRVCKYADSVDLDTGDYWALGGIYRDNWLVALPLTHVDDVTIVTDLDQTHKSATLKAAIKVAGQPGQTYIVLSQLFQTDGTKVDAPEMKGTGALDSGGHGAIQLSASITAPKLWSAEKPNLYYLVTTLTCPGKPPEQTQERFGFKQIEIKDGVVLWNGTPIKCTGTCRHEEWSALGHALTEREWQTDATLMKAANINAVRTSHYIDAERFLEICDEKGFYVLDEVPFCWADPHKEEFRAPFLQRTQEAYARDKNRPCVLAWSMGNESGYGPVNNAGFEKIKALDPTRPAFISSSLAKDDNPKLDFSDRHYPTEDLPKIVADPERKTKPLIITEGTHTFCVPEALRYDYGVKDFWVYAMIKQWSFIWPNDSMLGAFVWEWQDQGLADKFADRTGVDADGLRENNYKGFVDGYRNVKPDYFHVKMVYTPVLVPGRDFEVKDGKVAVAVQNRFSFTDLSELTCRWEAFAGEKKLAGGEKHIACAPRSAGAAEFESTPGMDTLRLEFIHPDGRSLYATRLEAKGLQHPAPAGLPPAIGGVKLQEIGPEFQAVAGNARLVVNKTTGAVTSWTVGGQPLLVGNFLPNLGDLGEGRKQDKNSKDYLWSKQPPQVSNPAVSAKLEGDRARITISADVAVAESPQWKGKLTETLLVRPDNQIDVGWELKWEGADARTWELGLKLPLPAALNRMQWRREGVWTEYPPDHIGAARGTATPADLTFRSTKRDLQWLTMSAPGQSSALCLLSDGQTPLHSRGGVENGRLVLYANEASVVVVPSNDFAHGLLVDRVVHLRNGQTYRGAFSLRATGGR